MNNPWEKALFLAGSTDASSKVMKTQQVTAGIYGNKCPRCGYAMTQVKLSASSDREVMYCTRDRVVVPLPVTE